MDIVFDAVDRVLETLRERWPRTLLAVGLTLWSLATAAIAGVYILVGGPLTGVLMVVLPVALLILIARRGIDRLPWPVWPLGVLLPVVLAGLLAPQAPRFTEPFDVVVPALIFVYTQIFMMTAAVIDELWRGRRVPAVPEMGPVGRRRILQVKILVATLVVLGSAQFAVEEGDARFEAGNISGRSWFGDGLPCLAVPMLLGVWWRRRGLAWYAAAVLPVVFALSLLPRTPEARWQALLAQGWIVVAASWQWSRAAVKPFWRPRPRPEPAEPSRQRSWPGP